MVPPTNMCHPHKIVTKILDNKNKILLENLINFAHFCRTISNVRTLSYGEGGDSSTETPPPYQCDISSAPPKPRMYIHQWFRIQHLYSSHLNCTNICSNLKAALHQIFPNYCEGPTLSPLLSGSNLTGLSNALSSKKSSGIL